jgi:hypothetical protein
VRLIFFSAAGWEGWNLDRRPLIRQGMPVLVDDDLRLEDEQGPRASVTVNQWLRADRSFRRVSKRLGLLVMTLGVIVSRILSNAQFLSIDQRNVPFMPSARGGDRRSPRSGGPR